MRKYLFAVLIAIFLYSLMMSAFGETREELINEFNRLENIKQILLRQEAIIQQLKVIEKAETSKEEVVDEE